MATFEGRFTDVGGLRIAVVVARFNDLVTAKLLSGCSDCLARHGVDTSATSSQFDVAWVPGSFELPLVSQNLAASGRYQVVITLGAVIRGDTPHFDVVVAEASKGIASVSRETGRACDLWSAHHRHDAAGVGARWHQEQLGLVLRLGSFGNGLFDDSSCRG